MPAGRFTDIRRFETVDSTNRYLLDEARSGAPEGVVAVAEFQTAGRGRLGRRWEAPAGANLLLSVLLRPVTTSLPGAGPDQRYLVAAALALAAADAAERTAGVVLAVKWPNDLLGPDGRKVAGVLAEADTNRAGTSRADTNRAGTNRAGTSQVGSDGAGAAPSGMPPAVVVGIGINVNWPASDDDLPPELAGSAGSLCQLAGRPIDRSRLLDALLDALEPRVAGLETPEGRARQAEELRSRCTTLGTDVRVELSGGAFEGRAVDLTVEGHLVVETGGARRTVLAGDVVHLRT